jgi:hypothetical protein
VTLKSLLIGGALALVACTAHAGTLFTQPWDGTQDFYATQTETKGFVGVSAIAYDDFHLDGPSNVTGIDFTGGYFLFKPLTAIEGFTATLYADNAGAPGAVISTDYVTAFNETVVADMQFMYVRHYSVAFGPVALGEGDYWMSLVPKLEYVQWMIGASSVGNLNAIQTFNGVTKDRQINLAFDIMGERASGGGAVPEPASWALMVVGIGLVGGALRTRRTAGRAVSAA